MVSVPVVGSVTANDCSRSSPDAILREIALLLLGDPCRSSVPMMYICAWHAPELAPERLISSRITDASVSDKSAAAVLGRDERREPAGFGQRADELLRIRGDFVDSLPVAAVESRAQLADALSIFLDVRLRAD